MFTASMANLLTIRIPSCEDRRAQGQARRKQMRRQQHRVWDPELRRHNPLELLEESMRGRVPDLVPLKYERMLASPFGFFRGAVPVMAADLAMLPSTGIVNQICGDAHVRNLGAYEAPDGRLVFDINDFDETTRAPFEWDLKRLATSLVLASRELGAKDSFAREAVLAFLRRYQRCAHIFSEMPVLEVVRHQVHRLTKVAPLTSVLMKAERATPAHTLETLTVPTSKGGRIFRENRPVLFRVNGEKKRQVLASVNEYRKSLLPERNHIFSQYRPIDVCFKVVGAGSVGTRDYCIYMEGNGNGDPLFLQIKEEVGSAYRPYLGNGSSSNTHWGRLVAEGQRAMQMQSDPFLGWTTIANRYFLVRQLNDHKAAIELEALKGPGLAAYAEVCGELLARGHARSGDVQMIVGYIGNGESFIQAIMDFAVDYATQSEYDWEALCKSKRSPRGNVRAAARKAAAK